jgi:hypothetical protein
MGFEDEKWINLAEDRNQWRAFEDTIMNYRYYL